MPQKLRRADAHIENSYTIEGYGSDEVFAVGSDSRLWPQFDNMALHYIGDDPFIREQGRIALTMTIDALPRMLSHLREFTMHGEVVECQPGDRIVIEGETSNLAAARIALSFSESQVPHEPLTTTIHYETDIELRNRLVRQFGKGILRESLGLYVPRFCEGYRDNVVEALHRNDNGAAPAV